MRQVETIFPVKWHDSKKWTLSVFEFEIKKYIHGLLDSVPVPTTTQ